MTVKKSSEQTPFPLKMLVISGAVLLIGACVIFTGIAMEKMGASRETACGKELQVDLKGRGTLMSVTQEGTRLRVTLKTAQGAEVLTVQACTGEILSSVNILID